MSIHGFQSNVSITYHQCLNFFHSLNPHFEEDKLVCEWLDQHYKNKFIKIDDIMVIISYSHCLTFFMEALKESLINQFVGKHEYLKILFRIRYFNEMFNRKEYKDPPKEGFSSKLNRLIFSKKPPPYYSDYRSYHINYKGILASLVFEMRQEFGYSKRLGTSSVPQLFSRVSLKMFYKKTKDLLM